MDYGVGVLLLIGAAAILGGVVFLSGMVRWDLAPVAGLVGRQAWVLAGVLGFGVIAALSASSLQFYEVRSILAIRNEPPHGVSGIHFRSNLSGAPQADTRGLVVRDPSLADFCLRFGVMALRSL